jgi:hypothetical protein
MSLVFGCAVTAVGSVAFTQTAIIVLRTDQAGFIAADSKIVAINGSQSGVWCKKKIADNFVFASSGLLKETKGPFDVENFIATSIKMGGSFE